MSSTTHTPDLGLGTTEAVLSPPPTPKTSRGEQALVALGLVVWLPVGAVCFVGYISYIGIRNLGELSADAFKSGKEWYHGRREKKDMKKALREVSRKGSPSIVMEKE
ncbi:hypothetical protein DL96DRAFT_1715538 [Flagelloscypha sp. PMI_526]|nr:hypothetical protein DL96DRAFT_1715538 [Flagelloscypha sp. PMI_526]